MQEYFSTLVRLFDWVNLRINVGKTFKTVYGPCQAAGIQSKAAYEQQMTGAGSSYRERQQARVQCSECWEDMSLVLLASHQNI